MVIGNPWRSIKTVLAAGLLAVFCGAVPGHAQSQPNVIISYWDHSAPSQETVIATQPSLLKLLGAKPSWVPIEASPPAIAAMKAGSFDFITGVGNPPVVSGIATGADFKVVWLGSVDYVELVVRPSIRKASDLAGKTVVDLVGSSEDYALRGWLKVNGLTNKVTVLGLPGMETPVAAYKSGRVDAAYVEFAQAQEMVKAGGHVLVDSVKIARLGYAGINVTIVRTPFARQHPEVVQGYVCAALAATKLIEDPKHSVRDSAFRAAAAITGQPLDQAVATGEQGVITADVRPQDEWSYFEGADGSVASGGIAQNYLKSVAFLVANGRIHRTLTTQDIIPHIDPSYVRKALHGGCHA